MGKKVKIMGILNVTPDSFSDGGELFTSGRVNTKKALAQAKKMIQEGADIIDVGGESSGPGSKDVSLKDELARVIPVILAIHKKFPRIMISIDTYKAEVARQAISAGAKMVNDVTALRGDKEMARVVAKNKVQVILMYSKDPSARTTREPKQYKDVIKTINDFLKRRIKYAVTKGIRRSQIIIDPGMGAFISSDPKYSYEILSRLREFHKLRLPILLGASRKSFLPGSLSQRTMPSVIAHMIAIQNGADIIRVHDVKEHAQALKSF